MEFLTNYTQKAYMVQERALDIQDKCQDFLVKDVAKNLYMDDFGNLNFAGETMPASDWALSQLGMKTTIPSHYIEQCINAGFPSLAAQNVNTWLKTREKSNMFIRTYDGQVRGILSDRYSVFDAPDILDDIFDVVDEDDWRLKGSLLNEERMHLRLVGEDDIQIANDPMFPAIFIDSSDVGRCAINIRFGIYRQVCTNGLIVPAIMMKYRQVHMGIKPDKIAASLKELVAHVPDMVTYSRDLINLAATKKVKMLTEEDINELTRLIRSKGAISNRDAAGIIEVAQTKYPATRWGIVNAITEFAQTKSLDARLELERAAGNLLIAA